MSKRFLAAGTMIILVIFQAANFFFFTDIQSGTASIKTAQFLNDVLDTHPGTTIGFIYMPTVAPLIGPEKKYQIGTIGGEEVYGINPLSLPPENLPTYIIGFDGEYQETLERFYKPFKEAPNGHMLYEKK